MPELPEVETIKNHLSPLIIKRRIQSVEFLWLKTLLSPPLYEFNQRVAGHTIEMLDRRGKYLILRLDSGDALLIHLRMTGSFLVGDNNSLSTKHTCAVVHLDGGLKVFFIDPRKFGKFQLVSDSNSALLKLGLEPLSDELTPQRLTDITTGKRIPVKALLMDQSRIAGIGNMYADEALFEARIHPLRPAGELSIQEINVLHMAIRQVLKKAIDSGGASISDYFHPDGAKGKAQEGFKVAHRRGEKCETCGGPIERIVVRQRGTYLCPICQR